MTTKPLLEQFAPRNSRDFEINYVTPVELTLRYYLTQMLEYKRGTIINMCSIAQT